MFIHLTLVPWINSAEELKTKPTQHSAKELLGLGIQPDILLCRCDRPIPESARKKIALFCNLRESRVHSRRSRRHDLCRARCLPRRRVRPRSLRPFPGSTRPSPNLGRWDAIGQPHPPPEGEVTIAIVGKYTHLRDSYKSLAEAMTHGGHRHNVRGSGSTGSIRRCSSRRGSVRQIGGGARHPRAGRVRRARSEGKIEAARFARERHVPYFGICFGMQKAVIEAARHLANLSGAGRPIQPLRTPGHRADDRMDARNELEQRGGQRRSRRARCGWALTMPCSTPTAGSPRSMARRRSASRASPSLTRSTTPYRVRSKRPGLRFSGMSPTALCRKSVEIPRHPWFIGVQFHPELKVEPFEPHPAVSPRSSRPPPETRKSRLV